MADKKSGKLRLKYIFAGGGASLILITILSLALAGEDRSDFIKNMALIILDMQANSIFPYPLTIQNFMIIMFGIGMGDVFFRLREAKKGTTVIKEKLLPEDARTVLTEKDLPVVIKRLQDTSGVRNSFLGIVIHECIFRFYSNKAVDQTHTVLSSMVDMEMNKLDLKYTMLRYIAWLLPTVGFIGTVLGISKALELVGESAENLTAGLSKISATLAIAFNTTLIALVLSSILVFFIHIAQQREEDTINDSAKYCLRNLINRLYVPEKSQR